MHGQTIDIRAVLPGAAQPVVISHWMHPGVQRLSLEAFLVELNVGSGGLLVSAKDDHRARYRHQPSRFW